jgi:hypothetical protein
MGIVNDVIILHYYLIMINYDIHVNRNRASGNPK